MAAKIELQVLDTEFQEELFTELDEGLGEIFEEIVVDFMEDLTSDEEFDDLYNLIEVYCKDRLKKTLLKITNDLMEE